MKTNLFKWKGMLSYKIIIILFLSTCIQNTAIGQPAIVWQHCFGSAVVERAWDVRQTSDGGYVLLGETTVGNGGDVSGNHGNDIWVVKTDTVGILQWQKCLGGSGFDRALRIKQTLDGGYIIAGTTDTPNDGDVSGNHDSLGYDDAWIVKLDASGTIQWQHCYGGTKPDNAWDIVQNSDGSYCFIGTTGSVDGDVSGLHGGQSSDVWLVKISNTGSLLWQKCLGGTYSEQGTSLIQTTDGGYILTGNANSVDGDVSGWHVDTISNSPDAWVVKTDDSGNIQWQGCYGGSRQDGGMQIIQTFDGGYLVAGSTNSIDGDVVGFHTNFYGYYDGWAFKLNATGTLQWQRCYGGTGLDGFYSVEQTADGGYILAGLAKSIDGDVVGNHYEDLLAVKTDTIGNIVWQRCLGGTDWENNGIIRVTNDNGYIGTARTYSNDGDVSGNHNTTNSSSDCWLVKLGTDTTVSLAEVVHAINFTVNPNPSKDYFTITGLQAQKQYQLNIINVTGVTVYKEDVKNQAAWMVRHKLPPGVYFITLSNVEAKTIRKLIVQ
ncbi:MAG TPA: T9SS type A sorting domain-containing protein [Bacteroidia bacterium]|jgi:hypothetical protein|nr:T9SS type A sorting domain-containing protein [Bacteroidia bacterium]HMU18559.1 T9SS type A sorting domain-containing protein [Bacteroidia bacterium]